MTSLSNSLPIYLTGNAQITFLKSVYRRHTDIYTQKVIHKSVNNKIKIEPTNFLGCIQHMWLNNISNIKNVAFFIVKDHVDIEQINFNTEQSVQGANSVEVTSLPNVEGSDNEVTSNANSVENVEATGLHDIQILHKISFSGLYSMNCNYNRQHDLLEIPNNSMHLAPALMHNNNRNAYILCVIESHDGNTYPYELTIKYAIANSRDEIRRFDQIGHEYLLKRMISFKHNIELGENNIPIDVHNFPVAHIIVNTDKNLASQMKLTYNLDVPNFALEQPEQGHPEDMRIVQEMTVIENDPEHFKMTNDKYDTYILDPYGNATTNQPSDYNVNDNDALPSGHQPAGNYETRDTSFLQVNSTVETTVDITYVVFDVLSLVGENVLLTSNVAPPPIQELVPLPVDENPINNNFIMADINWGLPRRHRDRATDLSMYDHIAERLFQLIEIGSAGYKKLAKDDNKCLITWEEIGPGEYYYECDQCKKCFSQSAYKEWYRSSTSGDFVCPHCRLSVQHYPRLYTNKDESFVSKMLSKLLFYFIGPVNIDVITAIKPKNINPIPVPAADIDLDDNILDVDGDVIAEELAAARIRMAISESNDELYNKLPTDMQKKINDYNANKQKHKQIEISDDDLDEMSIEPDKEVADRMNMIEI